ncbi:hypothetical protein [Paraburkholderia dioscoreae]|nr:hypothetical protein [Paraburkholderia dioscoreae]
MQRLHFADFVIVVSNDLEKAFQTARSRSAGGAIAHAGGAPAQEVA